ncbi:MAG TPA: hypothetical protein VFN71_15500, partial [Methylomirabilota bacterium]|nr:hypothetical protein [Methylomirabilota bacterium]
MTRRTLARCVSSAFCLLALAAPAALAGHELPFYPSYYPQEIRLEALKAAAAAPLLAKSTLHAFIGGDPFAGGRAPANVTPVESLSGYVILAFNPTSPAVRTREARCAAAVSVAQGLAPAPGAWVPHPYPITPFHDDYLEHYDLAQAAKQRFQQRPAQPGPALKLRARGPVAQRLLKGPPGDDRAWDATLEEVEAPNVVTTPATESNGWLGPVWVKQGWFGAWALAFPAITDAAARHTAEGLYRRLTGGAYGSQAERLDLGRRLVAALGAGCERVVLGYTLRREYFNS